MHKCINAPILSGADADSYATNTFFPNDCQLQLPVCISTREPVIVNLLLVWFIRARAWVRNWGEIIGTSSPDRLYAMIEQWRGGEAREWTGKGNAPTRRGRQSPVVGAIQTAHGLVGSLIDWLVTFWLVALVALLSCATFHRYDNIDPGEMCM